MVTPSSLLRWLAVNLVLVAIISVIHFGITKSQAAPEATFSTISGNKIVLSELRGKPVLVTFWATDCASCLKEIPHLIELYNNYHAKGLEIIAVAMAYDPPNHVLTLSKGLQLPYPVALDMQSENAHAFGDVAVTPTTFLISPEGRIVLRKTGLLDKDELMEQLEKFIRD